MLQEEQIKYFKLPFGKNKQETLVISVLDSSGSMSTVWPTLAECYNKYIVDKTQNYYNTCFDTKCYDVGQNKLSQKLQDYGGGGTHITQAFQNLNFLLKKYKKMPITVIFVSDGQGNTNGLDEINPGQLPFLNFICVGVGVGFPTFTAMKLREIFHNGDNQVPQVFLINMENYEQEFHEKFQMIQKYIQCKQVFKTSPCLQYPWEREFKENFPAETWVCSFDDEIFCEGEKIQPSKIAIQQLLEISKFWLQNLQAESLKNDVSQKATEAVKEITKLFEFAYPQKKEDKKLKKLTFASRLKERLNMCDTLEESEFNHIVQQIANLKQKDYLKNLTEAEAAKRLAIGTQVGHYQDKAMKWRGLSVEAFKVDRDELVNILKNNQFVQNDNMKSVITLQNQKEILQEQDIIQGLQLCPSQYDLVPAFPLIGYAIEVYLSSASDINSWLVQVRNVARINKYIDSLTVQQEGKNRVKLQIGDGGFEEVNCVLPLISDEDKDLLPFYKSRVFHSLMTFNLIKNIDQCDVTAHGALLANTYLHLIQQERSEFTDQMINMVKNTFDLCYRGDLQSFYTLLREKPQFALMVEHPTKKYDTKCEDPSKALIVLEIIKNQLTPEELQNIVERIIIEIIGRCNKYAIENFILYTNLKDYEQIWKDVIIKIYTQKGKLGLLLIPKEERFPFLQSVQDAVIEELKKQEIVLNKQHFKNIGNFRYEPAVINKIYKYFLNRNVDIEFIFACLYHSRNKTPKLRAKNPFERDVKKILDEAIKEHIFSIVSYTFNKACNDSSDYISCIRFLYEQFE